MSYLPLQGLRVLDLSRVLAGPFCSMILADLGADVVKLEDPRGGDETRGWGPPFDSDGTALYFKAVNRNKRSLALDLKTPEGMNLLRRLVERSDVVLDNLRPSSKKSLGISPDIIKSWKPGIIAFSITAFGRGEQWKDTPGYDFLIQAMSGLMSITGPTAQQPHKVGVAVIDVLTGLFAAVGILSQLAVRGGIPARVDGGPPTPLPAMDVSLFHVAMSALVNVVHGALNTGQDAECHGNGHPHIVPYQSFPTADGVLCLAVGNDRQFARLCLVLGTPELAADERFRGNRGRVEHRRELVASLAGLFARKPLRHWLGLLHEAGIPCAPVQTVQEALTSELAASEKVVARGSRGDGKFVQNPLFADGNPLGRLEEPPALGEHSYDILKVDLRLTDAEIEVLAASSCFGTAHSARALQALANTALGKD